MSTIGEAFQQARAKWAFEGMHVMEGEVREGLAGGKYGLKTKTGRLVNSTESELLPERDGFKTGTNVDYGRGWELGFTKPAQDIFPKRAKVLAFPVGGKMVFAKHCHIPSKTFGPRPWIQPAIDKCMPELQTMADTAFQDMLDKNFPDRKIQIT
jgi:hypothetical protein